MQATTPSSVVAALGTAVLIVGCASTTKPGVTGVTRPQLLIVPASTVERMAAFNYERYALKAQEAGRLIAQGDEYERVRGIVARLQSQASAFREDAARWDWQVLLIDAPLVNAGCAPGGKITVYTGLLRQLALTNDELAIVLSHEIAHALREHGRERMSLRLVHELVPEALLAAPAGQQEMAQHAQERSEEMEADTIGLELAARAGYDPRAAIPLWKKMHARPNLHTAGPAATHPSDAMRMEHLRALLARVMPLYETAHAGH
jgi:predicted Zn-dependent protease